jgi:hypothetical protein
LGSCFFARRGPDAFPYAAKNFSYGKTSCGSLSRKTAIPARFSRQVKNVSYQLIGGKDGASVIATM